MHEMTNGEFALMLFIRGISWEMEIASTQQEYNELAKVKLFMENLM